ELEGVAVAVLGARAPFTDDPPRQGLGGLDVDRVVERDEGLEWGVRPHPLDRADLAAGGVERRHRGIRHGPPPEGVEGPTVLVIPRARGPGPLAVEGRLPEALGLGREDARPADLPAQETAQREGLVADDL